MNSNLFSNEEPDIENPKDIFLLIKFWRHTLSMGQMLGQSRETTSKVINLMMEFENKNKKHGKA